MSDLRAAKPHALRYWEQEFTQLKPVKQRGNRHHYQHHEVLLIRCICELLYEQGFTINDVRNRSGELRYDVSAAPQVGADELETEVVVLMSAAVTGLADVQNLRRALPAVFEVLRTDKP